MVLNSAVCCNPHLLRSTIILPKERNVSEGAPCSRWFLVNLLSIHLVAKLSKREVVRWEVSDFSNSGNPICRNKSWDRDVIVITDGKTDIEEGDRIEFVIKKTKGEHYQALLKDNSSVSKPNYDSAPNIPLHHDGKHGQSVGDTRSEKHAMKSLDDRQ